MDLLPALVRQLGINSDLVDGDQPGFGKFHQQLQALVGFHRDFAKLVGLGFSQRVAPPGGGCDTYQEQQQKNFNGDFHFCSFLGGANMASRMSSPNCSNFFSTASTGGRSSAASVRRISSSARRLRRK